MNFFLKIRGGIIERRKGNKVVSYQSRINLRHQDIYLIHNAPFLILILRPGFPQVLQYDVSQLVLNNVIKLLLKIRVHCQVNVMSCNRLCGRYDFRYMPHIIKINFFDPFMTRKGLLKGLLHTAFSHNIIQVIITLICILKTISVGLICCLRENYNFLHSTFNIENDVIEVSIST